jgi:hypothetical protein
MKAKLGVILSALLILVRNDTNAQAIDFRQLEFSLPQDSVIDGYLRTKPAGETAAMMGFSTSWVEVRYRPEPDSSSGHISIRISDMIHVSSFLILAMTGNVDRETKTGYERTVDYKGIKLLEAYDSLSRSGKLEMPIAGRFLVQIVGDDVSNVRILYHFLELSDIARLEKLALAIDNNKIK